MGSSGDLGAFEAAARRNDVLAQLQLLRQDHPRSWRLRIASSTINSAGRGVFLDGVCDAGTVVAIYPGVSYLTDDLPVMHQLVLSGNSYVIARRDGVLIDGRPFGPSRQLLDTALERDRIRIQRQGGTQALSTDEALAHELAVGNMVNHPPVGQTPNVAVVPLDLWEGEADGLSDSHLLACVANFRPPTAVAAVKQTAVIVARRAIAGEELLLDYMLNAQGPHESWYTPCVGDTAENG